MIRYILRKLNSLFSYIYPQLYKLKKNIKISKGTRFKGRPLINLNGPKARILIDENVTLNSNNKEYFTSLGSPVKLQASNIGVIKIGKNSRLNGASVHSFNSISIGQNVLIASGVHIFDSNRHNFDFENLDERLKVTDCGYPISIGDNVWIGVNVIILPGVNIGKGSIIGAGSVVTKDIPEMCVAAGNPCEVLRDYNS